MASKTWVVVLFVGLALIAACGDDDEGQAQSHKTGSAQGRRPGATADAAIRPGAGGPVARGDGGAAQGAAHASLLDGGIDGSLLDGGLDASLDGSLLDGGLDASVDAAVDGSVSDAMPLPMPLQDAMVDARAGAGGFGGLGGRGGGGGL